MCVCGGGGVGGGKNRVVFSEAGETFYEELPEVTPPASDSLFAQGLVRRRGAAAAARWGT